MFNVVRVTIKGIGRDRVFQGIFLVSLLLLFVPAVSSLSMRQVTELSITLSLSLISFILLLLAVSLGGTSLWKDLERRYSFSVLGLPLTRGQYLIGKFCGVALSLLVAGLILWGVMSVVVVYASGIYPSSRPVVWHYLFLAVFYDVLKYILLVAIAFLFSTVSTSFFLPIFGTISIFWVGSASQEAYDFIQSSSGQSLPHVVRLAARGLYYILPNFSAFDLKLNAIYGVKVSSSGLLLTLGYFFVYTAITIFIATVLFSRRELK
jgi:ABC-type transport system involved in multi-copper enzyme maturation permease subunit